MDYQITFDSSNTKLIVLTVLLSICSIVFTIFLYKAFKSCYLWSSEHNIKMFSITSTVLYAVPTMTIAIVISYSIANKSQYILLLSVAGIVHAITLLINIAKYGLKYGILLCFFRMLLALIASSFLFGVIALAGVLLFIGGFAASMWIDSNNTRKITVIDSYGINIYYLKETGNGSYVDMSGKMFFETGSGNFVDDDGNYYYTYD